MTSFFSGLISRLTGSGPGGGAAAAGKSEADETEDYKGYTIIAAPRASGSQFNTAGVITRQIGADLREHQFIRADTHGSRDEAARHSISKAKQIIDEQGDRLFG